MNHERIAEYFVITGLLDDASPLDDFYPNGKNNTNLLPITDVTVIIRSRGENIPKDYTCIEYTPSGIPADLNHGSLWCPNVFVCYRRSRDKPPLVDIGILYEGKEKIMGDSEIVKITPGGYSANVNNSRSKTFITYRRAAADFLCNQFVVTDICIILANKNEAPPQTFCKIDKNLNTGMWGSDVYLCYKKSVNRPDLLCYKPSILARFPVEDYESFPLPSSVPLFCLPMGATVECWPKNGPPQKPSFSTFVLTQNPGEKVYGVAVTFYEIFSENKLSETMQRKLNFHTEEDKKNKSLRVSKSICLLSKWPFFDTFIKFLLYLYRISIIGGSCKVPLQKIIAYFMLKVPFPSLLQPKIVIQFTDFALPISHPGRTKLPLTGASFIQLLLNLGPDNCLKTMMLILTEQQLIIHSLRPDVLTSAVEAAAMLIFPLHWQYTYIPACPLGLSAILCSPAPYLVGIDSRYFDIYDPPKDVTCIDLDTHSIFSSEEKGNLITKLLDNKPIQHLGTKLISLSKKSESIQKTYATQSRQFSSISARIDFDFKFNRLENQLELEIREAFLRFMVSVLKGYRSYLRRMTTSAPFGTIDLNILFDLTGFLTSHDEDCRTFISMLMKTQMFIRFIEECSIISYKKASLQFFDECTEKIDSPKDTKFLKIDENQTCTPLIFVAPPPEPTDLSEDLKHDKQLKDLVPHLFHKN